jgi:hypothetical protein
MIKGDKRMKLEDIPAEAWTLPPTPVPVKLVEVPVWRVLHQTLQDQGFVIIESDKVRKTPTGVIESVLVKGFVTYLHQTLNVRLKTRRISAHRWYCTL